VLAAGRSTTPQTRVVERWRKRLRYLYTTIGDFSVPRLLTMLLLKHNGVTVNAEQ
jgi:hypothetical protein